MDGHQWLKGGIGLLSAALIVTTTVMMAEAHEGGSADVIHACVKHNGKIEIVGPDDTCGSDESPLDWNMEGPAGPPGPPGPAGSGAWTSVQYVSVQSTGLAARALCPPATRVVGGGGFVSPPSIGLSQSFPVQADGTNAFGTTAAGWQVASVNFNGTMVAFAICASP